MADRDTSNSIKLNELLRQLAAEDAPGIIDRARSRARARAERIIEERLVAELLAAAGEPAAPADRRAEQGARGRTQEADSEEAWWTYCVIWDEDAVEAASGLEGVEPGSAVETVCDGQLAALVSRVPLSEYGDEALREHLEDLEWVERTARRHEHVLEAALGERTIIPLRLCTLYRDTDGVRRLLRQHRTALRDGLARVDGCVEWGVKVFANPRAEPPETVAEVTGSEQPGSNYLRQRQQERALAEKAGEVRTRCVEVVHQRIAALARASTVNPPQRPEVHGRDLAMLLNSAHLIERDRRAELEQVVESLQEEWGSLGFAIELTGPWPPYNFVSGPDGVLS